MSTTLRPAASARDSIRRIGSRTSGALGTAAAAASSRLTLVRDPMRIVLFVLTILTISRVHQHYRVLAKLRPALLLVLASLAYAYLNPRYLARRSVLMQWPMRLIVGLGVLACCSAVFGLSLGASARFILDSYAKTLLFVFLIAMAIRHARDLYTFVWAYSLSCGILAFFSFFVFGMSKASNSLAVRLNDMYTYDANDICVIMMTGMALTVLLMGVTRGYQRWLLLLILVGSAATIARSGSRGGFLGFAAVMAAGLLVVNSVSAGRRLLFVVTAVLALALGAPAGYWAQMQTVTKPTADYNYSSLNGRKALVERGIGYMRAYPVFGIGINNFARAECSISVKVAMSINGPLRCAAPHNSYVQAGAELGPVGLVLWSSLLIGGVTAVLKLRRRLPAAWRRGTDTQRFLYGATSLFPLAMIGFAVTSFFVSFAWADPLYLLSALIAGLYVSVDEELREAGATAGAASPAAPLRMAGWRTARPAFGGRIA